MKKYYYSNAASQSVGPLPYDELLRLRDAGQITPETFVVEEGSEQWVAFSALPVPQAPPAEGPSAASPGAINEKKVMGRYSNAYGVARATIAAGNSAKIAAIVLGVLVLLAGGLMSFQFFSAADSNSFGLVAAIIASIVAGLVVTCPLYFLGILLKAQGQTLMASLDSAVHSSPFLNDEQKAAVMKLK